MATRFDTRNPCETMNESGNGPYVLFSDYEHDIAEASARVEDRDAQIDALGKRCARLRDEAVGLKRDGAEDSRRLERLSNAAGGLAATLEFEAARLDWLLAVYPEFTRQSIDERMRHEAARRAEGGGDGKI